MFNVTVIKRKDIAKYMCGLIVTLICIILISKISNIDESNKILLNFGKQIENILGRNMIEPFEQVISSMGIINVAEKDSGWEREIEENEILKYMMVSQISSIKGLEEILEQQRIAEEKEVEKNVQEEMAAETEQEIGLADSNLVTEIITQNPLTDTFHTQYGSVKIKNETGYELTEELLEPNISFENKNILIFQTHTCESYTPSEQYMYTQTGNYRTTDLQFSVARVGQELKNQLVQYGFNVYHDQTYHDYPSYSGSYTNSLKTVTDILAANPSDIVFDVHRDAVGSISDYAPTVRIGEDEVAQIMFVIGTNAGGLEHPNWQENLKFAIKIQEKAEEMYPGLFKTILLTDSRYNQHTAKYANIIEVGATGNTLEQSLNSMKYLAKVIDEVVK